MCLGDADIVRGAMPGVRLRIHRQRVAVVVCPSGHALGVHGKAFVNYFLPLEEHSGNERDCRLGECRTVRMNVAVRIEATTLFAVGVDSAASGSAVGIASSLQECQE